MKMNRFIAISPILFILAIFTSCQQSTEKIKAELEKAYTAKLDSLAAIYVVSDQFVLSPENESVVRQAFEKLELQEGETPVCKLRDGTLIVFDSNEPLQPALYAITGKQPKKEVLISHLLPLVSLSNYMEKYYECIKTGKCKRIEHAQLECVVEPGPKEVGGFIPVKTRCRLVIPK